ncbi:CRISPR-associated endoribonuclease Cas2 [Enhygromyxa salina]|uniref:CRISPR-associated endoribonuclease Cas2 n=1 Tax=Enhygromyxa salina TaxID=215803 RepID=A0A2S9YE03_9BACT|nr:CRISPR-associated endonuclease Cas2 [Enhygromyxa salina]PRQ03333.1 CRISPR-associated endoribonuclease Cas2 [Enhygromyxa salina]
MRRHYLISYDICNELRLRRVHGIVKDFGQPVQYSVFLARLTDSHKAELVRRLAKVVHHEEDQVLFFDLGKVKGQHEIEPPVHEVVGRPLGTENSRIVVV